MAGWWLRSDVMIKIGMEPQKKTAVLFYKT